MLFSWSDVSFVQGLNKKQLKYLIILINYLLKMHICKKQANEKKLKHKNKPKFYFVLLGNKNFKKKIWKEKKTLRKLT